MQRVLIAIINFILLFIILVGVPAATRAQVGNLQVSSAPTPRFLILSGLAAVSVVNAVMALKVKDKNNKKHCGGWAGIFAALWLAYFGLERGWFNFEWLKQTLLWFQKRF